MCDESQASQNQCRPGLCLDSTHPPLQHSLYPDSHTAGPAFLSVTEHTVRLSSQPGSLFEDSFYDGAPNNWTRLTAAQKRASHYRDCMETHEDSCSMLTTSSNGFSSYLAPHLKFSFLSQIRSINPLRQNGFVANRIPVKKPNLNVTFQHLNYCLLQAHNLNQHAGFLNFSHK